MIKIEDCEKCNFNRKDNEGRLTYCYKKFEDDNDVFKEFPHEKYFIIFKGDSDLIPQGIINCPLEKCEIFKTIDNKTNKLIDQISEIRKKNNENWMALCKLAFQKSPNEAKEIFKQITENDQKINELSKDLCK